MLLFFILIGSFSADMVFAQTIIVQREEVRQIMRERLCGVCHIPPGNEQALKIFNLNKINWSETMSDQQLEQIKWRIKLNIEEIKAQRGDPRKHQFMKEEIEILIKYVDAEIKIRNHLQTLLGQ